MVGKKVSVKLGAKLRLQALSHQVFRPGCSEVPRHIQSDLKRVSFFPRPGLDAEQVKFDRQAALVRSDVGVDAARVGGQDAARLRVEFGDRALSGLAGPEPTGFDIHVERRAPNDFGKLSAPQAPAEFHLPEAV